VVVAFSSDSTMTIAVLLVRSSSCWSAFNLLDGMTLRPPDEKLNKFSCDRIFGLQLGGQLGPAQVQLLQQTRRPLTRHRFLLAEGNKAKNSAYLHWRALLDPG
jgi:hypothetical protein